MYTYTEYSIQSTDDDARCLLPLHTLIASSGRFRVAVFLRRQNLIRQHDVTQCRDWLRLFNLTSYPICHLYYVISHAYGSTFHGRST